MSDVDVIRAGVRLAACEALDAMTTCDGTPFKAAPRAEQAEFAELLVNTMFQSLSRILNERLAHLPEGERHAYVTAGVEAFTAGIADALGEFGFRINLVPVELGQAPA